MAAAIRLDHHDSPRLCFGVAFSRDAKRRRHPLRRMAAIKFVSNQERPDCRGATNDKPVN